MSKPEGGAGAWLNCWNEAVDIVTCDRKVLKGGRGHAGRIGFRRGRARAAAQVVRRVDGSQVEG